MRADDEMSVQGPETTHVLFTPSSASELTPPDVPVLSVELEDSIQTMSTVSHHVQTSSESIRPCGTS